MRYISYLGLLLILAGTAHAADNKIELFNEAYRTYQDRFAKGQYDRAAVFAETALELAEELLADQPEQIAVMTYNLGDVQLRAHQRDKAIETLEVALERYRTAYGPNDALVTQPLYLLGDAHIRRNDGKSDMQRARKYYDEALDILAANYGDKDPRISEPLRRLATAAVYEGDARAAEKYLRRALSVTENAGPEFSADKGLSLFEYGKLKMATGDEKKALKYFLEAKDIFKDIGPEARDTLVVTHAFLVEVYERMDQGDKATEHLQYLARLQPETDMHEPEPVFRVMHEYPFSARLSCKEGYVIVRFTINELGRVKDPKIVESKPEGTFDRAALEAVNQYRFKPRIVNGQFVEAPEQLIRLIWQIEKTPGSKTGC